MTTRTSRLLQGMVLAAGLGLAGQAGATASAWSNVYFTAYLSPGDIAAGGTLTSAFEPSSPSISPTVTIIESSGSGFADAAPSYSGAGLGFAINNTSIAVASAPPDSSGWGFGAVNPHTLTLTNTSTSYQTYTLGMSATWDIGASVTEEGEFASATGYWLFTTDLPSLPPYPRMYGSIPSDIGSFDVFASSPGVVDRRAATRWSLALVTLAGGESFTMSMSSAVGALASASAVPEPGSMLLAAFGLPLVSLVVKSRRGRTATGAGARR